MTKGIIAAVLCGAGALMGTALVVAPPALAADNAKSTGLQGWYQHTGHQVLEKFVADANRFRAVTSSTSDRTELGDCKAFKRDAVSASSGKMPPQAAAAQEYRYFLQAASKGFGECVTGLDAMDAVRVEEGNDIGAQGAAAATRIINGTKAGQVVTVPTTAVNLNPQIPVAILTPQCQSDFKVLEVAVAAYDAQTNANPVPPAPWSATTYDGNFAPLLSTKKGGPYMSGSIETTHYVVEYDSSGNVWVEPPGQYDTSFNPAHGTVAACASVVK